MPTKKGSKWSKYKVRRRAVLRFLSSLYNKTKREALFDEDKKELEGIQEAIDLLHAIDYDDHDWSYKNKCPICGSDRIIYSTIEPCCFDSAGENKLGKIEGLVVNHCEDCGYTTIENPFADNSSEW